MFNIALRNLFQEKTRLAISVGGVASSVLLIILLQGLNIGFSKVLGQYLQTVPADLWVARSNTGNIMDASFVPLSTGRQLKTVAGVADVQPFGMQNLSTSVNGKDLSFYVVSYDPANDLGKPQRVSEGQAIPGKGEIIIDRIVAKSSNLKLGDNVPFSGRHLKIVGLSEGTFILSSSFAFVNLADAAAYTLPATTNYWVVRLEPGANATAIQSTINRQFPQLNAHTKEHFVQVNINLVKDIVTPVFGALVALGAVIGTAVIGLTIFVSTIEKAKEYGILKAIGLKNSQLYTIVFQQAAITAVIGFVIGTLLAYAINPLLTAAVPQFITQLNGQDLAWIFLMTLVMATVASYIPMRRLNKIDPAEVFKA